MEDSLHEKIKRQFSRPCRSCRFRASQRPPSPGAAPSRRPDSPAGSCGSWPSTTARRRHSRRAGRACGRMAAAKMRGMLRTLVNAARPPPGDVSANGNDHTLRKPTPGPPCGPSRCADTSCCPRTRHRLVTWWRLGGLRRQYGGASTRSPVGKLATSSATSVTHCCSNRARTAQRHIRCSFR